MIFGHDLTVLYIPFREATPSTASTKAPLFPSHFKCGLTNKTKPKVYGSQWYRPDLERPHRAVPARLNRTACQRPVLVVDRLAGIAVCQVVIGAGVIRRHLLPHRAIPVWLDRAAHQRPGLHVQILAGLLVFEEVEPGGAVGRDQQPVGLRGRRRRNRRTLQAVRRVDVRPLVAVLLRCGEWPLEKGKIIPLQGEVRRLRVRLTTRRLRRGDFRPGLTGADADSPALGRRG